MDRAGTPARRLTQKEIWQIFDAVWSGRSGQELRTQMSDRHRTTIYRAFNVAVQFEPRGVSALNPEEARRIAETAGNSATEAYVEDLFRQWKVWRSERLEGAGKDDSNLDGDEEHPRERKERRGIGSRSEVANAVAAYVEELMAPVDVGSLGRFRGLDSPNAHLEYGPAQQAILAAIRQQDPGLKKLEDGYEHALKSGDMSEARRLVEEMHALLQMWVTA